MKLYVLFSVLVLGILGWIIVEVRHRRKVSFGMDEKSNRRVINRLNLCFRRHDCAPLRRTARVPRPTQELPPFPRQTTSTTSWRRTLLSHICKSREVLVLCNFFLPHTRGSFPLPKIEHIVLKQAKDILSPMQVYYVELIIERFHSFCRPEYLNIMYCKYLQPHV